MKQECPTSSVSVSDPNAVVEVPCPKCGTTLEFFGEDRQVKCHKCGERVTNPKLDK